MTILLWCIEHYRVQHFILGSISFLILHFRLRTEKATAFLIICVPISTTAICVCFCFFLFASRIPLSQDVLKQTASSLDEMLHVSGREASEHTAAAALTELRNNNNHHMKNKSIANPNAIVTSILSKNHIDHLEANSVSVIPIDAADNGKQNNGSIISGGLPNTQQQSRIKGKRNAICAATRHRIAECASTSGRMCGVPFRMCAILASFRFSSNDACVHTCRGHV